MEVHMVVDILDSPKVMVISSNEEQEDEPMEGDPDVDPEEDPELGEEQAG